MKLKGEMEGKRIPQPDGESDSTRDDIYRYKDSGIEERHGKIPLWLVFVAVGLIVWGIYYTVRYWNSG
jgi:N-terminal domain of cytochrome oxidase-cbb3, FixP